MQQPEAQNPQINNLELVKGIPEKTRSKVGETLRQKKSTSEIRGVPRDAIAEKASQVKVLTMTKDEVTKAMQAPDLKMDQQEYEEYMNIYTNLIKLQPEDQAKELTNIDKLSKLKIRKALRLRSLNDRYYELRAEELFGDMEISDNNGNKPIQIVA